MSKSYFAYGGLPAPFTGGSYIRKTQNHAVPSETREFYRKGPFGSSVPIYSVFNFYNNNRANDHHFKNQTMQHLPGHSNEELPAYPYGAAYPNPQMYATGTPGTAFGYRPFLD